MSNFEVSFDAEQDLLDIISYTIENHGVPKMELYIAKLEKCADQLAMKQGHFRVIDVDYKSVRVKHCQHHYIFGFDRDSSVFEVIAIFHERMDLIRRLEIRLS